MAAGYDISAATSNTDITPQSATSGVGGSFFGGSLNKGASLNWKTLAVIGGAVVLFLLFWKRK